MATMTDMAIKACAQVLAEQIRSYMVTNLPVDSHEYVLANLLPYVNELYADALTHDEITLTRLTERPIS
jgi:hypothetical protein